MTSIWMVLWLLAGMTCFEGIMACYKSINSAGSTDPLGDINIPLGSELVINCTLYESYKGPKNSSDIYWMIASKKVSSQHVTILNERAAQLRIRNVSKDFCGNLSCRLKGNGTLCMNTVKLIGQLPEGSKLNFSCTSYEWKSLKCKWNVAPSCHRIPTIWTLTYSKFTGLVRCPKYEKNKKGESYECVFDETTNPTYDVFMDKFLFTLSGETIFEKKNYNFEVDHFSRVIASPPENLRNSSYQSTKLNLQWDVVKEFKLFRSPLVYQLKYSEWDQPESTKEILLLNQTSVELENLIPYTKYLVSLRCRSQKATDEVMWSSFVSGTFETLSTVPVTQVNTSTSNFIDIYGMDIRNVTLFWEPVPRSQHFGPNFHYIIWDYSNGEANIVHKVEDALSFSYTVDRLRSDRSYWFKIQAANELGVSPSMGSIFISKSSAKPPAVEDLTTIDLTRGRYIVSWKPPKLHPLVSNYSVVWCKGMWSKPRFQPCSTPLSWTYVAANESSTIINVDDLSGSSMYHFGVAINTINASSGLATWSQCIAPYDGIPGKMKMKPLIADGPNSIKVSWELHCSQQLGVITGFQVQYCISDDIDNCQGELKKVMVDGADKRFFYIRDLKPYKPYRVTVAGVAKSIGEACDPQIAMTKEAAPSDPPSNVAATTVSNTSISVRWGLPSETNGVLAYFLVHYNNSYDFRLRDEKVSFEDGNQAINLKNVECYTNYSITVAACTAYGCSPYSSPLNVLTEVGVPGQPEMPKARAINTHISVTWEDPAKPNGPIDQWNLFIMKIAEDETHNSTENVASRQIDLPFHCDNDKQVSYSFAVQAVTETERHEKLMSPWSDLMTLPVCASNSGSQALLIYTIVGVLVCFILIGVLIYCCKSALPKFKKIRKPPIVLPDWMDERKFRITGYNDFEKNMYQNRNNMVDGSVPAKLLNRLQSISSDEGRGSQNSTETGLHESSSFSSINDEHMYMDKTSLGHFRHKHNLSSDSSGCSTGEGSVSSCVTTRIHLSSDSGTEADFPTPVTSPDPVFCDTSSWPVGITSPIDCQLRLRNLQRLGEEDFDPTLVYCERSDAEQPEKEELTQFAPSHYCRVAVNKSNSEAASMIPKGTGLGPMDEVGGTRTSASPSTMYSRVALQTPLQSNVTNGIDADGEFSRRVESKEPTSYVALSNLSDTNRVQKINPTEEIVRNQTDELTPYSCVGIVTKLHPKTCSHDDQSNKLDLPVNSNSFVQKTELPDAPEGGSKLMPTRKKDQKTCDTNQMRLKRPSYIPLSRIPDLKESQMCQPGYSKVGHQDTSAAECLPKVQMKGSTLLADKAERAIEDKGPTAPATHGYVTLGMMDTDSTKEVPLRDDAVNNLNRCKLSFDPMLTDEPVYDLDDGSSWESELEISEKNLTEEDFPSMEQRSSSTPGYVCIGVAKTVGSKDTI